MKRRGLTAGLIALALFTAMLSGCSLTGTAAGERPEADDVALAYLNALAEGNFTVAREYDALTGGDSTYALADSVSMLDQDVFAAAQHISDVRVVASEQDSEVATVQATYSLDGKTLPVELSFAWSDGWVLQNSMLGLFRVYAAVDAAPLYPLPFTSNGVQPLPKVTAEDDWQTSYVAYPGVYTLEVDVDAALLSDPDAGTRVDIVVSQFQGELNEVKLDLRVGP